VISFWALPRPTRDPAWAFLDFVSSPYFSRRLRDEQMDSDLPVGHWRIGVGVVKRVHPAPVFLLYHGLFRFRSNSASTLQKRPGVLSSSWRLRSCLRCVPSAYFRMSNCCAHECFIGRDLPVFLQFVAGPTRSRSLDPTGHGRCCLSLRSRFFL